MALHPQPWHVIELCAGAGGLGLGIELAVPGARGVAYVEGEAAAAATLATRMEAGDLAPAPVWSDLATFDGREWRGRVHCVASGDPCQPNSVAGKGLGAADERFLIDQVLRVTDEVRPLRLFRENVPGNAAGQLAALVGPLEEMGYRVECGIFSSAATGNSHGRRRLVVMADPAELGHEWFRHARGWWPRPSHRGEKLVDTNGSDLQGRWSGRDTSGREVEARHARLADRVVDLSLVAPGPADPRWSAILSTDPLLAPALGRFDVINTARRNLGLAPLVDAIGRRGGLYRDLDTHAKAAVEREVRRISHALADRVERLRQLGNGCDPVAIWDAWCNLDARHRARRERDAGVAAVNGGVRVRDALGGRGAVAA